MSEISTYDQRCPSCPGDTPIINGDGPLNARVMCIGDSPGPEDRAGDRTMFGKSGREFNEHYLGLAGLHRNDVYVTNTTKCHWSRGDNKPKPETVAACSRFHLRAEIATIQPEVIVTMGATAASLVKAPFQLDLEHGFPRTASVFKHRATVMPMIHPSSGMHDGKNITLLRNDFKTLKLVLRGQYQPLVDAYPEPVYFELTTVDDVEMVLESNTDIAIDTESTPTEDGKWKPWCLTFAQGPHEGFLIRFSSLKAIVAFSVGMKRHKGHITMQNHSHDVPVLTSQGIPIDMMRVRDTMMRAYHLGNGLPQGLKAMAFRVLGSRMLAFEDLVQPYWKIYAEEYLRKVAKREWPKEKEQLIEDENGCRLYRPQNLNTKLKRLFTDFRKSDKDEVLERFWDWPAAQRDMVTAEFGLMPRPSVALVPFEEVLEYACHDAVNTWRLGQELFSRTVRLQVAA